MFKFARHAARADEPLTLTGHLTEFRNRVAISIAALVAGFAACFMSIRPLADRLLAMGKSYGFDFVYLAPTELLTSYFKLSMILSAALLSPFLLFIVWGFVAPALTDREKQAVLPAILGGLVFFALGTWFCCAVALPLMLQFLSSFGESQFIRASLSVSHYLDFLMGLLLTFGLVFEEPMLVFTLSSLGILTPQTLRKVRRYAIPVIFVVAAVITPPDVISQLMIALPMMALYELSIGISCLAKAKRERREAEAPF